VYLALPNQHAKRSRRVLLSFFRLWPYHIFQIISYMKQFSEKKYLNVNYLSSFLSKYFSENISFFKKNSLQICHIYIYIYIYICLHVMYPLNLPEFSKTWSFSTYFVKFSSNFLSVKWKPSCSKLKAGWTDSHHETNTGFSEMCEMPDVVEFLIYIKYS